MTKALVPLLAAAALLAGCDGNGAQEAGPVPSAPASESGTTTSPPSTTQGEAGTTTQSSQPVTPRCSAGTTAVVLGSQQGAAGTIRTVWRIENTGSSPCRSFGYPGMDFHLSSGWADARVHRGGFADINAKPADIVVRPGRSFYFVSYWSDVTTESGPCQGFDRIKVTLPDNFNSARVSSSGCVNTDRVYVGPVTKTRPAA
jgi:hypothetical protein